MNEAQEIRTAAEVQRVAALRRAARVAHNHAMAALNAARTDSVQRRAIPWPLLCAATGDTADTLQADLDAWIARKATA